MAWTAARSVRRLLFPPGGLSAKNPPQMLCSPRLRCSPWCLLRSFGRAPLISYVFTVLSCGEAFHECTSQFSSALFYFDTFTVHFASAISTTLVLYGLYAFAGRGVTVTVSQSIVLQVRHRFPQLSLGFSHHTISYLAFCLPRPLCHDLHSHISLLHSSCSPSSLPAPVTSSSSIMCHLFSPLLA